MITVVTATFNRRPTLERLWQSLCSQTEQLPFEWVLVDDGSTDDTTKWFDQISQPIHIKTSYVRQPNQGKHVAINTAVKHATGDWIVILDSDDLLTADAIETITSDIIKTERHDKLLGLSYRKSHLDGKLVGKSIKEREPLCLKPNKAGALFEGDLAYVFKKTALAKSPFPTIPNEKFVPELLIWNKIADEGDILYFPAKSIYLCEYLPDGYSAKFKTMLKQNPRGFSLFYRDQVKRLNLGIPWIKAVIRYLQCQLYAWINP